MISKRKRNTILVYCIASVVMLCALASNVTKVTTNLKTNSKKVVADNQTVESTEISYGLVALEASSSIEENKDAKKETEEKKEEKIEANKKKADKDKSSSKKNTTKKTTQKSTKNTTKKSTPKKTTKKVVKKNTTSNSDYKLVTTCTTEVVDKVVTSEDGTESTVQENVEKCTTKKVKIEKKKTANTTKGKQVVAYAKKFVGKSYRMGGQWNGELPYRATDCSGFTKGVYKHFGISLPRVARDQARVGKKVAWKDLQPGDLIFYSGNGGRSVTHAAMYIGNGKIIHAQTPRLGIGITTMNIMVKMTARRVI